MAKVVVHDILEQILVRLDVEDLIRYKSVCKSWRSLISSPRFIKADLNHSYNNDGEYTRILMLSYLKCGTVGYFNPYLGYHDCCQLLGSSNGLICISALKAHKVLLVNPSIREVKKLPTLQVPVSKWSELMWGFGYDSFTDDYKVVVGFKPCIGKNRICFKVFSLKSNVWKVVGGVKLPTYACDDHKIGILHNGALHWFMREKNSYYKKVIMSFDFSEVKFKVIPQPNDDRYAGKYEDNKRMMNKKILKDKLGIIKDHLCIFRSHTDFPRHLFDIWLLKKDSVKQSWENVKPYNYFKRDDEFKVRCDYISHNGSYFDNSTRPCMDWEFVNAPVFVKSLVAPHVSRILKRKRSERSSKLNKGGGSWTSYRACLTPLKK